MANTLKRWMTSRGKILTVAALAIAVAALGQMAEAGSNTAGTVSYAQGKAERKASGQWKALKQGDAVAQGDQVKTGGKSRLEIKLLDGSVLRLGAYSRMTLQTAVVSKGKEAKKQVKAKLWSGRAWASVTKLFGSDSSFEVTTDNAVAGVRGTRFQAESKDGKSVVKVYDGKVLISNQPVYAVKGHTKANRVRVAGPQPIGKKEWEEMIAGAMQMVTIAADGSMAKPADFEMASAKDDDWEAWNSERDKVAGFVE